MYTSSKHYPAADSSSSSVVNMNAQ